MAIDPSPDPVLCFFLPLVRIDDLRLFARVYVQSGCLSALMLALSLYVVAFCFAKSDPVLHAG